MDMQPDHHRQLDASTLSEVAAQLPPLPPVIRYYDDFDDTTRSIRSPASANCFVVHANGSVITIDFASVQAAFGTLLKHVFLRIMGEGFAPRTAAMYTLGGRRFGNEDVIGLLGSGPTGISSVWTAFLAKSWPTDAYSCAKSILKLLC